MEELKEYEINKTCNKYSWEFLGALKRRHGLTSESLGRRLLAVMGERTRKIKFCEV
jgi:hypothetical protein